ncbi:hypothetical protein B484DRAFT_422728 [Ochromonadaceae sp. CCMP2298]|nr:hypothetical protein B484DRAFT_422728 [Ochromonadaceae sp. CCMP2298]
MAEGYASSYGYQNRGNGGGQYPPADQGGRYPPAFQQAYGGRGYQVPAYQYGQMAQAQPNMGYFPGMQVAGGYAGYGAQAAGGAAAYGGAYSGAARADGGDFRSSPQQGGIPGPSEKNGYEGPPHVYHSHGQARPQVQQGAYGLGVFQGQAQVAYQQAQVAGYGAYPAATGQGASPARGPPAQDGTHRFGDPSQVSCALFNWVKY